ncbi:MAG: AMP-binding protein [Thermoleophilaceae bacterium]|nr:AMP-binding protein [Thermoleophilaceae bacterium]
MRVEQQITIEAAPTEVWAQIVDPVEARHFLAGMTRWDVDGETTQLGSRITMRMGVGSAEVGSLVEVVEYDENCDLAWTSVTGLDQRGRWRLRERTPGWTTVTFRLSYQAPGGLLGTISDRFSSPMVRQNLKQSLDNLKRRVEGGAGSAEPDSGSAASGVFAGLVQKIDDVRVLRGAGVVRPVRPDRIARSLVALNRFGPTPAAGYAASAIMHPDDVGLIDELGELTFREIHDRTNALGHSLSDAGVMEGQGVGVMCRNHRGFIEATIALSKLGANCLYLNTAFSAPQLADVCEREQPVALIYDQEFDGLLEHAGEGRKRFVAWQEGPTEYATLEELIEAGDRSNHVPPSEAGRVVILTSGTTGTPKGATRKQPDGIDPAITLLSKIPLKTRNTTFIVAPLFHSWGFAHFSLGMILSATYVLRRKFDPEATLETIERYKVDVAPMVPVMLQRIMELPPETRRKYDTGSLTAVPLSGSALPGELAVRFMDDFGDVAYNLYGSTEVAWATIATPADLRAAPGTAGRIPRGTTLRIYDERGSELPTGETGRIFVANEMLFEGYTGGGGKEVIDGLMSTGDVGYLDESGRLFVVGRDDDMIVSGGENVFPREVEDLISDMDGIVEVSVIGVDDKKFGQRLKAFVVQQEGSPLDAEQIQAEVKSKLAGYKVPRDVEFIDELPRNATGKVLKRELAER